MLRVLHVQLAQFGDKICGHATIRVRELTMVKGLLASVVIVRQKAITHCLHSFVPERILLLVHNRHDRLGDTGCMVARSIRPVPDP